MALFCGLARSSFMSRIHTDMNSMKKAAPDTLSKRVNLQTQVTKE
jgi:hypothetical protein